MIFTLTHVFKYDMLLTIRKEFLNKMLYIEKTFWNTPYTTPEAVIPAGSIIYNNNLLGNTRITYSKKNAMAIIMCLFYELYSIMK